MISILRNSVALILLIGAGLVHGAWTNRWNPSPAIAALGTRIDSIPMAFGGWKGVSFEIPSREIRMAGATSYLARRYTNAELGASISVLIVSGLPGDVSSHTPDVCYPGAGFTLNSPKPVEVQYGPERRKGSFRTALATRGGTNPSALQLFWAWNSSRGWSAPDDPRWSFVSVPALSKLYVVRESSSAAPPEGDPAVQFLEAFLTQVDRFVFDPPI